MLKSVWSNNNLSMHIKIKIYKTIVRLIHIYGYESWYSTIVTDVKPLVFENKALRRILGTEWQDKITNEHVKEITKIRSMDK